MSKHGTFFWNELATGDLKAAKNFYGKLLGWTTEEMSMADGSKYTVVKAAGGAPQGTGGMMQMPKEAGVPDGWLAYVAVDDVDAAVARAKKLGGAVPLPPFDIEGVGRIAHVSDPNGARLGLITALPMEQPAPKGKAKAAATPKARPQAKPKAGPKAKPKSATARRTRRG
jgi:predicted enzyme related to lactoylglutathione lyase